MCNVQTRASAGTSSNTDHFFTVREYLRSALLSFKSTSGLSLVTLLWWKGTLEFCLLANCSHLCMLLLVFCVQAKSLSILGDSCPDLAFLTSTQIRCSRGRLCSWFQHSCFGCFLFTAATVKKKKTVKKKVTHDFHTFFQASQRCLSL